MTCRQADLVCGALWIVSTLHIRFRDLPCVVPVQKRLVAGRNRFLCVVMILDGSGR